MNQEKRELLFQKTEELAAETGFCEFKIIENKEVVFTRDVRTLCEHECAEYQIQSYSLPPFVGTYEECMDRCSQYGHAILVTSIHPATDIMSIEEWMVAGGEMNGMLKSLAEELEQEGIGAFPLGMRCRRCEKCGCPDVPCRNPETMLSATEAYGIHIMNTMEQHGITGYYDGQTIVCFGVVFLDFGE